MGKKQGRNSPATISGVLSASFSHLGIASKIREYSIKKAWKGCVGENIAKRAAPHRLIGKTLYCNVSSSAWMAELTYHKTAILQKLNRSLGSEEITEIVLKIGTVAAPREKKRELQPARELTAEEKAAIEKTVSGIKDEGLRSVIKRALTKSKH